MRGLFTSDFFLRFVGGFALGAVALIGMQPDTVKQNLTALTASAISRTA